MIGLGVDACLFTQVLVGVCQSGYETGSGLTSVPNGFGALDQVLRQVSGAKTLSYCYGAWWEAPGLVGRIPRQLGTTTG